MKRCSESEIMKASKPEDIFSSDLETIAEERKYYLETFVQKDYSKIKDYVVIKKIKLLYNQMIVNIAEKNHEEVESVENKIEGKAKREKNYEAVNDILKSCEEMLTGFNWSLDESERRNKIDEYYMLRREIRNFEDKLIEMGNLDRAYDELNINQYPSIQISDMDIRFIVEGCKGNEIENIKKLAKGNLSNPMEILFSLLVDGKIYFEPAKNLCINSYLVIRIARTEIKWLAPESVYYFDGRIQFKNCNCYISDLYGPFEDYFQKYDYQSRMISAKAERTLGNYDAEKELFRVLSIKGEINKEAALIIIRDIQREMKESGKSEYQEEIYDFKEFISYLNSEITLLNLRKVHSELERLIRKYKIEREY